MATTTLIEINHANDSFPARTSKETNRQVIESCNYLRALVSGARNGTSVVRRGHATQGTAAITCAGVLAGDTVTANGVVFTAVNGGTPTAVQFDMSGSDALTAARLAAAVAASASAKISGILTASPAAAVATFVVIQPGATGKLATLTSSNSSRLAVTSNPFQDATNDTPVTYSLR